jgi:purine catabolism regulator
MFRAHEGVGHNVAMVELTVSSVLQTPAFRHGGPVVLAGSAALDRPVRWLHATELTDIGPPFFVPATSS